MQGSRRRTVASARRRQNQGREPTLKGATMPQPYRSQEPIMMGPGTVLKRPNLALQIANVVDHWRNIEETLELLYGQILRASISKNRQSHRVTDLLSSQILNSLYQIGQKTTLTSKALSLLEDPSFNARFSALKSKIDVTARHRNEIVHNTWGVSESYPDALILHTQTRNLVYTFKDFEDIITRMRELSLELLSLLNDLPDSKPQTRAL